jgi:quercetin dioxygenase-like cupin family protein
LQKRLAQRESKENKMKNIEFIKSFEFGKIVDIEKTKEVKEIFNGARRRMVNVELRNHEILSKHKAAEPITIFCLAGSGTFRAGKDLEDEQILDAGTLITLEADVEHEVVAGPDISLLVTKFKAE